MGVLEKIIPFVHFAQFVGLFPYRIKTNPFTGRFKGFFFSSCHNVTFWFVLSTPLQFFPLIIQALFAKNVLTDLNSLNNMPLTIKIVYGLTYIDHFVMIVVSRFVTLRYKQLRLATDSIAVDVVRSLEELEFLLNCQNTVKSRTFVGIFFIFTLAIGNFVLFIAIDGYQGNTDSYGSVIAFLVSCFYFFAQMTNDCTILMFHLSYYCLAHHILLLRAQLTSNTIIINQIDSLYCKSNKKILVHLHKASAALGSLFSFPVLLILVIQLSLIALCLFGSIYFLVTPKSEFTLAGLQITLFMATTSAIRVFIILHAADMPVYQMRYLREQVIATANRRLQTSMEDHLRIMSLLQHLEEERFRLKAAGLFPVGTHLLPAVIGSIVTYLVILLQYELH